MHLRHSLISILESDAHRGDPHDDKDDDMAFYTDTAASGFSLSALTERLTALRTDLSEKRAQRKIYRTTVRELGELSNRELADLGLSRGTIRSVAYEAAYGVK